MIRIFFTFSILVSLVILSACGFSSNNTPINGVPTTTYEGSGFSVLVPTAWSMSGTIDQLPVPVQGRVVLAALSAEKSYNFANNFVIIEDELPTLMSSEEYSRLNNTQTTKKYLEYAPIRDEAILFPDQDDARVYVFKAKYNSNTPLMQFVQTAKVCGTRVYLLHISIALNRDPTNYIALMRTFECK